MLKSTPLEPEKLIRFRKYNSPVSLEDTFLVFYKTINCTQVKVVIVDLQSFFHTGIFQHSSKKRLVYDSMDRDRHKSLPLLPKTKTFVLVLQNTQTLEKKSI